MNIGVEVCDGGVTTFMSDFDEYFTDDLVFDEHTLAALDCEEQSFIGRKPICSRINARKQTMVRDRQSLSQGRAISPNLRIFQRFHFTLMGPTEYKPML